MTQILTTKGRSLMLMVLFALSLAVLIVLSGAASRAEAQDVSATNTVLQQLEGDGKLNSDVSEQLEAQNRLENSSGAATEQYREPEPEPNHNSSALPLMLGSGALLVGGGLLARRL